MKFHGINWLKFVDTPVKLMIVRFLCRNMADLSEREIAGVLKVSHMSVNRALRDLSKVNFTYQSVIGGAHVWRVNRKSYAFKVLNSFMENELIFGSLLSDFKSFILKTLPDRLVSKVILFGSVAKQLEKDNSDIDLFVMVKDEKSKVAIDGWLDQLSTKCLELYGNRFAPYVLTQKEFEQKHRLDVIKDIEKGVIIYPLPMEFKNVA